MTETEIPHEDDLTHALIRGTVDRLWDELKMGNDEQLTFEQAEMMLNKSFGDQYKQVGMEQLKTTFKRIDQDGNEKISKGEMGMFLLSLTKF